MLSERFLIRASLEVVPNVQVPVVGFSPVVVKSLLATVHAVPIRKPQRKNLYEVPLVQLTVTVAPILLELELVLSALLTMDIVCK